MTTLINGVVILGRSVPERISDGRDTVCVAGWCESHGLIRLYPTRHDSPLQLWNIVNVEVERNPKDNRGESWKFPDSRTGWEHINEHMQVAGSLKADKKLGLLDSIKARCVQDINAARGSLGIIKPIIKRPYLKPNAMYHAAFQPLFDDMGRTEPFVKRDYDKEPRLCYLCGESCRAKQPHDMQLLEWGCYQWMRKNPGAEQQMWLNMGIGLAGWTHYLLVGNQANQRTSFMVINVLRQKATAFQYALV